MTATATKAADDKKPAPFKPRTWFTLKLGWPSIYPEHREAPFEFDVRSQLVSEAEKLQRDFLMAPDADPEQKDELQHQHDVAMLAMCLRNAPRNVPGFPEITVEYDDNPKEFLAQATAACEAFFLPSDRDERDGMRFIVRNIMARYWQAVMPADYL